MSHHDVALYVFISCLVGTFSVWGGGGRDSSVLSRWDTCFVWDGHVRSSSIFSCWYYFLFRRGVLIPHDEKWGRILRDKVVLSATSAQLVGVLSSVPSCLLVPRGSSLIFFLGLKALMVICMGVLLLPIHFMSYPDLVVCWR